MLRAGCDAVLESGLDVSLEMLSLEELIQVARVPRSAVYRKWPYKDAFIDELLCYVVGPGGHLGGHDAFDQETIDMVHKVIADNRHLLGTAGGRRALLREVVRQGAGQNFRAQLSPRMRIFTSLMGAVRSSKNLQARSNIAAAIEETQARSRDSITELIRYVMTTLGLRMRDSTSTVEQLQAAGAALIQGLAMRHDVAEAAADQWSNTHETGVRPPDQVTDIPILRPGLDGQPAEWTLAALGYLGVVDSFLEPDPDFDAAETAIQPGHH
jgi:AcrR family transcriptional regulator